MKKFAKFSIVFLGIFVVFSGLIFVSATNDEPQAYTINEPYEYPIVPGTPEWAEMYSYRQMVEACEIPEEILHNMTTEALVESVITYPLSTKLYEYNDVQTGYDAWVNQFNGLQELERRSDALDCLTTYCISSYQSNSVEDNFEQYVAESLYGIWTNSLESDISPYYTDIVSIYNTPK